jgi:hypothetical protein
MSLIFFADHCVPDFFSNRLREAGFEVDKLREQIAIDSPDKDVIDKAQQLKAILISLKWRFR